jgi:hypothetical protein
MAIFGWTVKEAERDPRAAECKRLAKSERKIPTFLGDLIPTGAGPL